MKRHIKYYFWRLVKLLTKDQPFCTECYGPYPGWLRKQYGGHWDTCPNRWDL